MFFETQRRSSSLLHLALAQLAERRSLAGELSMSCARPKADEWPLCGYTKPSAEDQL